MIAAVCGTIAVFLVRGLLPESSAGPGTTRTIVIAAEPVNFGAPLGPENLREIPWPIGERLEGSFATIHEVVAGGRRLALAKMQRNEPVLSSKITAPNQRATLSTQIDDGMRAVTVRVDEVRGVAGFVLPGDRVDVVLTRGEGGGQDAAAYADVLLQNAKVLAIDQLANERQDKPAIARAVTLELSIQEAQKVVLAQGVGRLSLLLRQAGGAEAGSASRVTASDLGLADLAPRNRLAEVEKRLDEAKVAAEAAQAKVDRDLVQRLADMEARLRESRSPSLTASVAPLRPLSSNQVINVIRNGAKTEQYSVASER